MIAWFRLAFCGRSARLLLALILLPAVAMAGQASGPPEVKPGEPSDIEIASGPSRMLIDASSGRIKQLSLGSRDLLKPTGLPGPFRLHVPLPDFEAQIVEGCHAKPQIVQEKGLVTLTWPQLVSKRGAIPVKVEMTIMPTGDGGFEIAGHLDNGTTGTIPQVFFPWVGGIGQLEGADDQVTFARSNFKPWQAWKKVMSVSFQGELGHPNKVMETGNPYNSGMKWMDFSGKGLGVTLYCEDTSARTQYTCVASDAFGADTIDLAWITYPFIGPGQSWQSSKFVLYPHEGDWRRGVLNFKQFADKAFTPVKSPPTIDTTLGEYTLWMNWHFQDWQDVKIHFTDIPAYAREALAAGLNQMTLVRSTALDFCLPHVIRKPLGTEAELKKAYEETRAMGMNMIPFVTCRIIRPDTIPAGENKDEWFQENVAGQKLAANWTYDPNMIPSNVILQNGARAGYNVCTASVGFRKAFFANLEHMERDWSARGIFLDQSNDAGLCFNPLHHHKPDEEAQAMNDLMAESRRRLVAKYGANAIASGEGQYDTATEWQDLTWDWIDLDDAEVRAPFAMAFPQARECVMCADNIGWINKVFAAGYLLNVSLEGGQGRLGKYPELTEYLKSLAKFKEHFINILGRRDTYYKDLYLTCEPADGVWARAHRKGDEALVMVTRPDGAAAKVVLTIDLKGMLGEGDKTCEVWTRDLKKTFSQTAHGSVRLILDIPANDFMAVHIK